MITSHNTAQSSLCGDGKKIFLYFACFFGLVLLVNVMMITLAMHSYSGLVTDHAYEKGLNYNKIITKAAHEKALGWEADIRLNSKHLLQIKLLDSKGKLLNADKVTAAFTRPAKEGTDFVRIMSLNEQGIWQASINFPQQGLWEIRIYAKCGNESFQQAKRVVVK